MCSGVSMQQCVVYIGNKCTFVLVSSFILGRVVKNSEVVHLLRRILGLTLNPFKHVLFRPMCVPGNCMCCVVLSEGM